MLLRMFLYLFFLIAGGLISYKWLSNSKLVERIDKLQMGILLVLLFIMGVKIGSNQEIVKNIGEIGFVSCVFAISGCFFSVLLVYVYRLLVIERRGKN